MSKLTLAHAEILRRIADREVSGSCIRYVWTFRVGHAVVTKQVHALAQRGLVTIEYYSGGNAAVSITDAGRDSAAVREQ